MKGNPINRTGIRYGMLVAIREVEPRFTTGGIKRKRWECQCDCGKTTVVDSSSLAKNTQSCGCTWGERHGMAHHPLYTRWCGMIARCENSKHKDFHSYGGRGITVCPLWRKSFSSFVKDMGNPPTKAHSIERKNGNGNYESGNCFWATPKQQSRNSRQNHFIEIFGDRLCINDWAARMGVNRELIKDRIASGWDEQAAVLFKPRK